MIEFTSKNPEPEEYLGLRKLVGWNEMPLQIVESSLKRNLYSVCAYSDNVIIGTARVVGDGGLCFYIQDVMVHPDFQKKGIGTRLIEHIMEFLKQNACYNSYVGLMAARGVEDFYTRFGFVIRPNELYGSGMTQFWGRGRDLAE